MCKIFLCSTLLLFSLSFLTAAPLPALDRGVENALYPMILVDGASNTILYANPACAAFFSIPRERLVGRSFPALIGVAPKDIRSLQGQYISLRTNEGKTAYVLVGLQDVGSPEQPSFMVLLQDRSREHSLLILNRLIMAALAAALVLLFLFLSMFLIYQSRQNKRLAKERQQQEYNLSLLKQFLDADSRYSYIKDNNGRFLVVNENLTQLFSCEETMILGKRIEEVAVHDLATMMTKSDQKTLDLQRTVEQESQWEGRLLHMAKFPLLLPDGTIGLGSFAEDITERRHQEQILKANLARTARFSQLLSHSIKDPQSQLDIALDEVCSLSGSTLGLLLFLNEEKENPTIVAITGKTNTYNVSQKRDSVIPFSIVAPYLPKDEHKGFLIINEAIPNEPIFSYYSHQEMKIQNMLVCTCKVGDQYSGIVILAENSQGYSESEGFQIQLLFSGIWANILKAQNEAELEASKRSLRLILDSTAEGIFGTDVKGFCTFCNVSCLRLLGYQEERELLGKNMHLLIHHATKEGFPINEETCPIRSSLTKGIGIVMEDEVFWRKDGTYFDVLCYSYPQKQNGNVTGSVITFLDNTERKNNLRKIAYLSFHDQLTGLHNRSYADEAMVTFNSEEYLPLSLIVGDVNGLKLTNDIFGHMAGDQLLCNVAESLKQSCRSSDVVSRIGGDEFLLLLPHTGSKEAQYVIRRIEEQLEQQGIRAGKRSIALGSATKVAGNEKIQEIFDQAEDQMYRRKTLRRAETQKQQLQVLTETLYEKAPEEQHHALQVQKHAAHIAALLQLSDDDANKLTRAGYYHDIGKVVLEPALITAKKRDAMMQKHYQEHVSAGYRILNMFEETVDLAPLILHHHEWWNGSGYLKGLRHTEIPYFSRILRLAEVWEREHLDLASREQIKNVLLNLSGIEVDPHLVERILNAV
ncbi:MAG: diguanylate cyclase [Sphaerochaetaceae bacterium]